MMPPSFICWLYWALMSQSCQKNYDVKKFNILMFKVAECGNNQVQYLKF